MFKLRIIAGFIFSVLFLTACKEEKVSLSYLGVNHRELGVASIAINGEGGILNVPSYGGGGKNVCCVSLPRKWRPGLSVKIDWQESGVYVRDDKGDIVREDGFRYGGIEGAFKSKTVLIPEYKEAELGHFDIHFFDGDQIQVKVSSILPWHPNYLPAYPDDPSRGK
jgi:hypothetical protein